MMNSWRIKRAYKHRKFPPLNSREKKEREMVMPFIQLKRTTRKIVMQGCDILLDAFKETTKQIKEFMNYENLKPYFGRDNEDQIYNR